MVTKRARSWLARGSVIAVTVVVVALGSAAWVVSSQVDAALLRTSEDRRPERVGLASDPSAVGLEFVEVLVDGALGAYPAWWVQGSGDTWVVLVHGFDADRSETLRVLPALERSGVHTLAVSYRNDGEAPDDGSGRHHLGRAEWSDLRAALDFARGQGAGRIVLYGYGGGGSIIGVLLQVLGRPDDLVGVVLDAPLVAPGEVAMRTIERAKVPGFLASWAKAMATFRFGIPWSALDHLSRAADWEVPTLVFHGDDDTTHPIDLSRRFVASAPDAILVTVEGAGHGEAWNVDPERYEAALLAFLENVAIGD